jgi:predicted acylesterase/phospholipase RssA
MSSSIGLCFSGGGFRASFYALGVLRYLAEARHMNDVVAISAVSGGSIATAAAGDRWAKFQAAGGDGAAFLAHIDKPFRDRVTSTSIRRKWMLGSVAALIPRTGGRGGAYARALAKHLYEHDRVADLPRDPDFIFTATDLTKGRAIRIAPGFVGSYDYGYVEPTPTAIKLGDAVAASAAFPPSFTVVYLRTDRLPFPKAAPDPLSLVDGGVYDNLGLEWFQGWGADALRPATANKPDITVVANASGLLAHKGKTFRPLNAFPRDLAIQYEQSLSLRVRWNDERMKASPGSGIYMAIRSDPQTESLPAPLKACQLPSELVKPLALLRTDLDRFSKDEADLLSYHAYWTLHARLSIHKPQLAMAAPSWTEYANLGAADTERLRKLLEFGSHRSFRGLRAKLGGGS